MIYYYNVISNKADMVIFPAIDLKNGKAVRLNQGLMSSAKIYSKKPYELAKNFEELGSEWLHIVDLDGACSGEPKNLKTIEKIVKNSNLNIQIGGGIRDEKKIISYMNLGVKRIILGSIAVKDINFAKDMAKKYPIVIGIDAKDGKVAIEGWKEKSSLEAIDFAKNFKNSNIEAIICTDISKDGMLSGVNINFTENIALASGVETIASGGVKNIEDIIKCKNNPNISGVIIGKAFYENCLDLKEAIILSKKV